MNVLTLPRYVAALEYKAMRLPATLLQSQVAVLFDEDSKVRLGFERALGALDETAGTWFADDSLSDRGRVLRRRSEILGKAVQLEEVADQRKAAAEATLREATEKAERTRQAARSNQREGVQEVLRAEQAEKQRIEQTAKSRVQAEKNRVEDEARAKARAVTSQLDSQEARIDATEKARTAAPKAQLTEATQEKQTADAERAKADRLADLAAAERDTRKEAPS
jgi:hypothetical protein